MNRYFQLVLLGIGGMFFAHLIVLMGYGIGLEYPIYLAAYPLVYSIIIFIVNYKHREKWFMNICLVFIMPVIYWYSLLAYDNKLNWNDAINYKDSSGMLLILPFSILIVLFVSMATANINKETHSYNNNS